MVLFASDNGAPSKMGMDEPGLPGGVPGTKGGVWNGSNNVPMRGEKGSLFEGGIRVPMFAYWKSKIIPGTVIEEMVTTLDLTATTLKAGGGTIPDEFDGVDLLPRLTGKLPKLKGRNRCSGSSGILRQSVLVIGNYGGPLSRRCCLI